jgi:hypothetical protein
LLGDQLRIAEDDERDTRFGVQSLKNGQSGLHRNVFRLVARAVAGEHVAGEQTRAALSGEQADVHRAGILTQPVGEQFDRLFVIDGDVVIADVRDHFLNFSSWEIK